MFSQLQAINSRPKPFEFYTAADLWTDEHTSKMMLAYHINEEIDVSSRKGEFIDRSVKWIARRFSVTGETAVADFGCGPGLYANKLAEKGARVTGIDFSARSLDHARKVADRQNLKAEYIHQNYLEFDTDKRFDLIIMIMCDFCALSPRQRKTLLGNFRRLLKPGGSVLLDVYTLGAFDKREEAAYYELNQLNGFWSAEKYYGFVNTFKYENEKVILDKYTLIEANRTRTVYNWLQHFSRASLEAEFVNSGFRVKEILGDVAGSVYDPRGDEMAVVAVPAA